LVILHELGHATGGYAHGRLSKLFGYKANRENYELNKEIIRKCFGTPLPNNVG
jgi:hypothetical protein